MTSPAAILDEASHDEARAMLKRCCGSARWGEAMLARRPFGSDEALFAAASEQWARVSDADVVEALMSHPRIGASALRGVGTPAPNERTCEVGGDFSRRRAREPTKAQRPP